MVRRFGGCGRCGAGVDEVFAEVVVPEGVDEVQVGGFGVPPMLLDAALHAGVLATGGAVMALPFLWQGVSLHAAGVSAARVRIAPAGAGGVSVDLADGCGLPVLSVRSMVARPVSVAQLTAAVGAVGPERLFEVVWSAVSAPQSLAGKVIEPVSVVSWDALSQGGVGSDRPAGEVVVLESRPCSGAVVAGVYGAVHRVLEVVQSWLAADCRGTLLVCTVGAVALPGEDVSDLAGAAVWGLVRSAQTENPGRIVLVDSDGAVDVAAVMAAGEPQVVVRAGVVYTARLAGVAGVGAVLSRAGVAVGVAVGDHREGHVGKSGAGRLSASRGAAWGRAGAGGGARGGGQFPRRVDRVGDVSRRCGGDGQ